MIDWQPIETVPTSDADDEDPEVLIFWIVDTQRPAFGRAYKRKKSRTIGLSIQGHAGNFTASHWARINSPA